MCRHIHTMQARCEKSDSHVCKELIFEVTNNNSGWMSVKLSEIMRPTWWMCLSTLQQQSTVDFNIYIHAPTFAPPSYSQPHTCLLQCHSPCPCTGPTCDWWPATSVGNTFSRRAQTRMKDNELGRIGVGDNGQGKLLPPSISSHLTLQCSPEQQVELVEPVKGSYMVFVCYPCAFSSPTFLRLSQVLPMAVGIFLCAMDGTIVISCESSLNRRSTIVENKCISAAAAIGSE